MIKQFIPVNNANQGSVEQLIELLSEGEFNSAQKMSQKLKLRIDSYPEALKNGVRKLLLRHRAGELLSFVFNHPDLITIELLPALQATYAYKDYHAFLKNCVRFKFVEGLKAEIDIVLTKLRPEEAASWKTKIDEIDTI